MIELGPIIRARLRDSLPSTIRVLGISDVGSAEELMQQAPAVFVIWDGYRVQEVSSAGRSIKVGRWLTAIAVRSAGAQQYVEDLDFLAAGIEAGVDKALAGWNPNADGRGQIFVPVSMEPRPGLEPSLGIYALAWEFKKV